MPDAQQFIGETNEAFSDVCTTRVKQPTETKPGQLTKEQLDEYYREGFVVLRNFFAPDELQPCLNDIANIVDKVATHLYEHGAIKDLCKDYDVFTRMTIIEKLFPGATVILHKLGILPEAIQNVWANERLLNIAEQLIGPNIAGHPVWNLRVKTPHNEEATVPWHQDIGYTDNDHYKVHVPTVWVPLLDVNEENGCLQFCRKGHRTGRVARHTCCAGKTWYLMVEEEELEKTLQVDLKNDLVTLPMKFGDIVLFNNFVPHRSLENYSNKIRWSLDLRYFDPAKPAGFYGLKKPVVFRLADKPNMQIDWNSFCKVNRDDEQDQYLHKPKKLLDNTMSGPWMTRWEIVHVNKHVESMKVGETVYHEFSG